MSAKSRERYIRKLTGNKPPTPPAVPPAFGTMTDVRLPDVRRPQRSGVLHVWRRRRESATHRAHHGCCGVSALVTACNRRRRTGVFATGREGAQPCLRMERDLVTRSHRRSLDRIRCLFAGHVRAPLSLPGGSRLVFAGPCRRCGR